MILHESFTEAHIRELQDKSRRDPVLLERAVYAFGLLEALARVGLPFIFKGGTCLMLLLEHPRRLSTDIDIIVAPGTDMDAFLDRASTIFPFQNVDEQRRIGKNQIEKRHFKFTYYSPVNQRPFYILLDVLFEENHYAELVSRKIQNELLLTGPEYLEVTLPSADCILADKLTAFAPHTTGIPLNAGKDLEVMKQFYDVTSLLAVFSDRNQVWDTYKSIAQTELAYRGISASVEECLWDTFHSALCIAARGKFRAEDYPVYVKGTRELRNHIYAENYTPEIAATQAPKVMYLAACLLSGSDYTPVAAYDAFLDRKPSSDKLLPLSYLKKVNPEAYSYVIKADSLLSK